jgi:hypothetical protein
VSALRPIGWGLIAACSLLAACGQAGDGGAEHGAGASASPASASADQPLQLVIENHRFTPSELTVPANQPVVIEVVNKDPNAEEFDSTELRVEKVIAGNDTGTIRLHPLDPGRYSFIGEFHSDTAKGVVIAK